MTSDHAHLYANLYVSSYKRAPGLLRKLVFLLLAMIAVRVGSYFPISGINNDKWSELYSNTPFAQFLFPF